VEQRRRLVTEIPGPGSRELFARRNQTVSGGVGTVLPIFVERAAGGVLGPEAFAAKPFLDLLTAYGSPWGIRDDHPR